MPAPPVMPDQKKGIDWQSLIKDVSPQLGNLFGQGMGMQNENWVNPATQAGQTIGQIPNQMSPYFQPYINAGNNALPQLQSQYGSLLNDPGGVMNKIGGSYQQSPGLSFAIKQALQASKNAAASGGMAGSPQHELQNMGIASNLASNDYNQWLSNALNLYQGGLSGNQNLYNTGFAGSSTMADAIKDALARQAELQYKGQAAENEHTGKEQGSFWGSIGNLAGTALPYLASAFL